MNKPNESSLEKPPFSAKNPLPLPEAVKKSACFFSPVIPAKAGIQSRPERDFKLFRIA